MKDPTSWIMEECIPDGFQWKDPSNIQKEEVYCLLDHLRAHQASGLESLIWVLNCPLLKDSEKTAKHAQAIQQAKALPPPPESDEEVFVLPDSDDIDLEGDKDDHDNDCSGQSSKSPDSSDDSQSPDHDVPMGHLDQVILGGSHIVCYMLWRHCLKCIMHHHYII